MKKKLVWLILFSISIYSYANTTSRPFWIDPNEKYTLKAESDLESKAFVIFDTELNIPKTFTNGVKKSKFIALFTNTEVNPAERLTIGSNNEYYFDLGNFEISTEKSDNYNSNELGAETPYSEEYMTRSVYGLKGYAIKPGKYELELCTLSFSGHPYMFNLCDRNKLMHNDEKVSKVYFEVSIGEVLSLGKIVITRLKNKSHGVYTNLELIDDTQAAKKYILTKHPNLSNKLKTNPFSIKKSRLN